MQGQSALLTATQVLLVLAPVLVPRALWARRQQRRFLGIVLPRGRTSTKA